MVILKLIFFAFCFLLNVLQVSHARIELFYRHDAHYYSPNIRAISLHPEAAELCGKMLIGAMYALQGVEYAIAGAVAGPIGVATKFATQESTAYAIDAGIDEASNQAAQLITESETLQQEFANTIKFCTYAGLCVGSVKAGKKLVSSLSTHVTEQASIRAFQRKIGNVGKFKDLTDGKPFHDGKQAHHMPAQKFLKSKGLNTNDGLSIILTKEQHAKTRTFRSKAQCIDLSSTYRDELVRDIKDVKRILKEDGSWTPEVRRSLMNGLDNFRAEFPQLFEKVKK